VKVIPDQLQRAAEKEILEGLGFIVLEIAPTPFAQAPHSADTFLEHERLR
jgi:hypothetical protein